MYARNPKTTVETTKDVTKEINNVIKWNYKKYLTQKEVLKKKKMRTKDKYDK